MASKTSRPKKVSRDAYLRGASQGRDFTPDSGDYEISTKKRLHSTRDSFTEQSRDDHDQSDIMDDGQVYESLEPDSHAHKRSRPGDPADWPLRNDFARKIGLSNSAISLPRRSSVASLNSGWNSETPRQHVPGRPSRFHEGSMNDRASKNPPPAFTEGYDAVGRYLAEQENISYLADPGMPRTQPRPRDKTRRQKPSISQNSAGTAESQRSGIWRFGKAIADWFNYNKFAREEDEKARQKRILERRQEKAMRMYEELKRTGQLGALGKRGTRSSTNLAAPGYHQTNWSRPNINNRDSGVDVDDGRHIDGQGDALPSHDVDQILMPPPSVPVRGRSQTPSTVVSPSARQSSFNFRRPSVPNLKKVRSEAQLPSSNYITPFAALSCGQGSSGTDVNNAVRKQPSRKDLQKQHKLSQKVSDLESKLQAARRELSFALGEAESVPPLPSPAVTRKTFTGGALPSLPSESLVTQEANGHSEVSEDLGMSVSDVQSKTPTEDVTSFEVPKANIAGGTKAKSVAKTATKSVIKVEPARKSKKRKSTGVAGDSTYKPGSDTDDDPLGEYSPKPNPKRKPGRPKKLQKTNVMDGGVMRIKDRSAVEDPRSDITDASVNLPPRAGYRKSRSQDSSVPPVPKLPASVERLVKLTSRDSGTDSTNVDPEKRPQPERLLEPYEWPEDVF
ncbi:hypothetical protein FGG08_005022 [Glutinoglossum americanum]|uniref:Uncharacterized protein n=1 Tax=Glutinoglossum americanum TaxID=1670608 RepID=A0A9P8I6A0_9PEZI|nr:hypothetical protein FGG08_005022 [Glutinoglossum americanum]